MKSMKLPLGTKASACASARIFWMPLNLCSLESQRTRFNFQSYTESADGHCCPDFHLGSFFGWRAKWLLFSQSCMQVATQFVGVNEHNKSLKRDAHSVVAP